MFKQWKMLFFMIARETGGWVTTATSSQNR